VQQAIPDTAIVRIIENQRGQLDRNLPEWARRSNPIVRRHLGTYWKTIAPDVTQVFRWLWLQAGFIVLSFIFPALLTLIMPAVTVSLVLLPIAAVMYVQALFGVGTLAAESVVAEKRNGTLDTLRATPRPLHQILLSKMAAAVWRQVEDLNIILLAVALLSLPVLVIQYGLLFSAVDEPYVVGIVTVVGLCVAVLRVMLEPIMVGALGILMGTVNPNRVTAVGSTALLAVGYYIVINLPRLIEIGWFGRILLDMVVPLALPVMIIVGCLHLSAYLLSRD
jgi:ABC-type Na+ efflux pump permease subunit